VLAASLAWSSTLFGREFLAIADRQTPSFGIDIPRQYNGTNFDRVSQVGPGESPIAQDANAVGNIDVAPGGIIVYDPVLTSLDKVGRTVTCVLPGGDLSTSNVGDQVNIIGNADGYNGAYIVQAIQNKTTAILLAPDDTALPHSNNGKFMPNMVFVQMTTGMLVPPSVGMLVTIAGATDATFDSMRQEVRKILTVGPPLILQVYIPALAGYDTDSGGGTLTLTGNINAGVHLVSVAFLLEDGYLTRPAPYSLWTAAGGLPAFISNIPIGPANCIARYLIFSLVITPPAISGPFFYLDGATFTSTLGTFPTMIVNDNTTTQYLVDFTDAILATGESADALFNLLELGECSSVCAYSERTFWGGERAKLQNMLNLTFDGGWSGNRPLGWLQANTADGAGGSKESVDVVWGDAYKITGDGASVVRGYISQDAYQDYLGNVIFDVNIDYSVRVRLKKSPLLLQGQVVISVNDSFGVPLGSAIIDQAQISRDTYTEFILHLLNPQATILQGSTLSVSLENTPSLNGYVLIENIEPFQTNFPYNLDQVRASLSGDPASFLSDTGKLRLPQAASETVIAMFPLLDSKLYMVTQYGIYSTQDDGSNEPSKWPVSIVSTRCGCLSIRAVAVGEAWAIIVAKQGIYIFWGSEPVRISTEIQPDWDTVNWAFANLIYAEVDWGSQRIHVGAPVNGSAYPNAEFVCDYSQLANTDGLITALAIASSPQVTSSGDILPKARKWTLWNINAMSCKLAYRSDNSQILLRGNATNTGKVYYQSNKQLSDDGTAIASQYQTAYFPDVKSSSGRRHTCKYMTGYSLGAGTLSLTMYAAMNQLGMALSSLVLSTTQQWDWEKNINFVAERMSLSFGTDAVESWFQMTRVQPEVQVDLVSPVRGNN
jgi:hypothetical protein